MTSQEYSFQQDIDSVAEIKVVPLILEALCRTTGMGFAAVARVTPERWIACGVRDEIKFGLLPGGELKVDTTLCHEVRQNNDAIVIDHVAEDVYYCNHHTPVTYGLQSYFSIPISKYDGSFFGTLCAIDPSPALVTSVEIRGLFKVYAELISVLLNAVEHGLADKTTNMQLQTVSELDSQVAAMRAYSVDRQELGKRSPAFVKTIEAAVQSTAVLIESLKNPG